MSPRHNIHNTCPLISFVACMLQYESKLKFNIIICISNNGIPSAADCIAVDVTSLRPSQPKIDALAELVLNHQILPCAAAVVGRKSECQPNISLIHIQAIVKIVGIKHGKTAAYLQPASADGSILHNYRPMGDMTFEIEGAQLNSCA